MVRHISWCPWSSLAAGLECADTILMHRKYLPIYIYIRFLYGIFSLNADGTQIVCTIVDSQSAGILTAFASS